MSMGKPKYAQASAAEIGTLNLGKDQIAQGNNLARPNLLALKDVITLSDSDRANALALAKAQGAQATADTRSAIEAERAASGATSGRAELANTALASATGGAMTSGQVGTTNNLRAMDLNNNLALASQMTGGQGLAVQGLRAGADASASAALARTADHNRRWEQSQKFMSTAAMLGLKGLGYGASKWGTTVDADGGVVAKSNGWGWLRDHGFSNDAVELGKWNASANPNAPKVGLNYLGRY